MTNTETATAAAHRAIAIAAKLSQPMRLAVMLSVTGENGQLRLDSAVARVGTRVALIDRGIAETAKAAHELTHFGRMVHAVLVRSAEEVLAWAGRRDAERYIGTEPATAALGELAYDLRGDGQPVANAAYRAALLDELHGRALAEDELRTTAPCGCPVGIVRDEGHQEGCEELDNPHATHTGARNACPDDRCRAYLARATREAAGFIRANFPRRT